MEGRRSIEGEYGMFEKAQEGETRQAMVEEAEKVKRACSMCPGLRLIGHMAGRTHSSRAWHKQNDWTIGDRLLASEVWWWKPSRVPCRV